jgi:broad specificity phosphatase PhoE
MKIHVIRHGETDYNEQRRIQGHAPAVLSEKGIQQAIEIAETIKIEKPSIILTSEMIRAIQTAKIISQKHNIEIIPIPELNARDFGDLTGISYPELKAKNPELFDKLKKDRDEFIAPNGESTSQIEVRVKKFIQTIPDYKKKYESIIVVTHREVIPILLKSMNSGIQNIPNHPYEVQNCAIYCFDF